MLATQREPHALEALNDKELEILRLLTAGHTVKSIAARLDRSEASVHERLREARRKTGVGSSRELARLVDAQKNWDKNIDLSAESPVQEMAVQPVTSTGRLSLKGINLMFIAMPLAAIGLASLAADSMQLAPQGEPMQAVAAASSPLVGRWSLDVMRIPEDERPQRVTIDFRVGPDKKWTTNVEIVGADGSTMQAQSTAAPDGVPVAGVGNMPFVDTVSLRHPSPGTLVMTLGKGGAPVSTRVYTASKDGKSMTETIIWASTGIPRLETTYFTRVG